MRSTNRPGCKLEHRSISRCIVLMFRPSKNFEASKSNNTLLLSYSRLLGCALEFWSVVDRLVLIGDRTRQVLIGELICLMGRQRLGPLAALAHHRWSHRDFALPHLSASWLIFQSEMVYPTSQRRGDQTK